MNIVSMIAVMVTTGAVALLQAQAPAINKMDPSADELVSPTAKVETLKNEFFAFLEGPVWVKNGNYLLFSDLPANAIYKWQDGKLSVFMEKSGFTGTDASTAGAEVNNGRFQTIVLGSNGLTIDPQGNLVMCQHGNRQVVRVEKNGMQTVLADRFEGKRINGSNDVIFKSNGSMYFSDPSSGLRGGDKSPLKELPYHAVFLLKDGKLSVLDKDPQGVSPNGLAFSPDEKNLYVTAGRKIVAYDVKADDTIANPRVLFDYASVTMNPGGFDGIKVDSKGNIWGPGPGPGVWAISPAGKPIVQILTPEAPANLAFGDPDGKGLYLTARRGLYKIRTNVAGIIPGPK